MPVTAKLSKLFNDRVGQTIANELVDWFNAVDTTYRADLRELNELNFARFDAMLEQRVAELHTRIDRITAELEARVDRLKTELESASDRRKTELEARIDRVEGRLDAKIDRVAADLKAHLERRLGEQAHWLFVGWATLLAAIIALWVRI